MRTMRLLNAHDTASFLSCHRGKIGAKRKPKDPIVSGEGSHAALSRARQTLYELLLGQAEPLDQRWEEFHGSQDEIPGVLHCLGHSVQERLVGRGRLPFA